MKVTDSFGGALHSEARKLWEAFNAVGVFRAAHVIFVLSSFDLCDGIFGPFFFISAMVCR